VAEIPSEVRSSEKEQAPQCGVATIEVADPKLEVLTAGETSGTPAEPAASLYVVHIPNLTEKQAEVLLSQYAGAWKE
jgi:hypothetical protein